MTIDLLAEARVERNQMTERIVSGIKSRSRYRLNTGVFIDKIIDGKTWVESLLYDYQSAHSRIGRFLFEDQRPFLFTKEQLPSAQINRNPELRGLIPAKIDLDQAIIDLYRDLLPKICEPGEDQKHYGETAEQDCNNLLTLCERVYMVGRKVAKGKISKDASIIYETPESILEKLTCPKIENEVASEGINIARRHLLPQPEIMDKYLRDIIKLVLKVEVDYVLQFKKDYEASKAPIGFGQVAKTGSELPFSSSSRGFGSK